MPVANHLSPIQKLKWLDPENEAEIERLLALIVGPLLTAPQLRADLMPPGRHKWFEGFLKRAVETAFLNAELEEWIWSPFEQGLKEFGVIGAVCHILRMSRDPSGQDERRGYTHLPRQQDGAFLQDRADLREILEDAIRCDDCQRSKYPAWYGNFSRSTAAKYVPLYSIDDSLVREMLKREQGKKVAYMAAVRISQNLQADETDNDELLFWLLEACQDTEWIWSSSETYCSGRTGCHEALLLLKPFGWRGWKATAALELEIENGKVRDNWGWPEWLIEATGVYAAINNTPEVEYQLHFGNFKYFW